MSVLSKLLGTPSPFKHLLLHLEKVLECVGLIEPLVNSLLEGDEEKTKEISLDIFRLEHEADEIKDEIRNHLPRGLMMAVSRHDFIAYLREQDNLADKAEDLAMMISIRKLRMPDVADFRVNLEKLASRSVESVQTVIKMAHTLEEYRLAGFKGDKAEEILEFADKVGNLEYKADKHQFTLVQSLLSIEDKSWQFVETYTWMQIISSLGKLADHAEKMSDYIRLMIAD